MCAWATAYYENRSMNKIYSDHIYDHILKICAYLPLSIDDKLYIT